MREAPKNSFDKAGMTECRETRPVVGDMTFHPPGPGVYFNSGDPQKCEVCGREKWPIRGSLGAATAGLVLIRTVAGAVAQDQIAASRGDEQ